MKFPAVLDNTIVNSFRNCEEQFKYNYCYPIKPIGVSIDLVAGAAFAKGLEVARRLYYEDGWKPDDAVAHGIKALFQEFGDPPIPEKKRNKNWDRLLAGYESYFAQWPLDTDFLRIPKLGAKHAIEFTFAVPLPLRHPDTHDPLLYCGRCDSIVYQQDAPDALFCEDDKTASQFRESWASDWQLRAQFYGYMYAARQYGLKVLGTFVRGTCLQLTQIRHLQAIVYGEPWKLERWYHQLLLTVQRMIRSYEKGEFEMNLGEACTSFNGCPYSRLCIVKDPTPWINIDFEPNTWSPLTEPKIGGVKL